MQLSHGDSRQVMDCRQKGVTSSPSPNLTQPAMVPALLHTKRSSFLTFTHTHTHTHTHSQSHTHTYTRIMPQLYWAVRVVEYWKLLCLHLIGHDLLKITVSLLFQRDSNEAYQSVYTKHTNVCVYACASVCMRLCEWVRERERASKCSPWSSL